MTEASLKTVLLYGFLGRRFGRVHRFAIHTPAEAFHALSANFPDFLAALREQAGAVRVVAGLERDTETLGAPLGERETVRIIPVVAGGGIEISALIGALSSAWASISAFMGTTLFMGLTVGHVLGSLALMGVSALLSGGANNKGGDYKGTHNDPSYNFKGPVNTTRQGNCVPVLYGELHVGSQTIHAAIDSEEHK